MTSHARDLIAGRERISQMLNVLMHINWVIKESIAQALLQLICFDETIEQQAIIYRHTVCIDWDELIFDDLIDIFLVHIVHLAWWPCFILSPHCVLSCHISAPSSCFVSFDCAVNWARLLDVEAQLMCKSTIYSFIIVKCLKFGWCWWKVLNKCAYYYYYW